MTNDAKPSVKRFNHRHKQVAINQASGMNQTDAYLAVYHCDYETAKRQSSVLNTTNYLFKDYLNTLIERKNSLALDKIVDDVMQPAEVKARLSELARANLVDFLDDNGQPKLSKDTPHHSAAKEYSSRTKLDRDGNPIISKSIKLTDQIEALRELAKIHGMYAPTKHQVAKAVQINVSEVDKTSKGKQGAVTLGSGGEVLELEDGE